MEIRFARICGKVIRTFSSVTGRIGLGGRLLPIRTYVIAFAAVVAGANGCLKDDSPQLYTDVYWFRSTAFDFKIDSTRTDPDTISVPVFRMRNKVFDTDTIGFIILSDTTTAEEPRNFEILTPIVRFADPDTVRSEILMIVHPQTLTAETLTIGLQLVYQHPDNPAAVRNHDKTIVRITATDGPSKDVFWFGQAADTLEIDTTRTETEEFPIAVFRLGDIRHKTDRVAFSVVSDSTTAQRSLHFDLDAAEAIFATTDTTRTEIVLLVDPQALDTLRTVGLKLSYQLPSDYEDREDRPGFTMLYLKPVDGSGTGTPNEPDGSSDPEVPAEDDDPETPSSTGELAGGTAPGSGKTKTLRSTGIRNETHATPTPYEP